MNDKIKIIGICGYMRSGKDTFANLYRSLYGQHIKSLDAFDRNTVTLDSFAFQLKHDLFDLAKDKFGWNIYDLSGENKEIFRPLMIAYGGAQRKIDSNYWVKVVADRYEKRRFEYTLVISDFRYFNEYLYFKNKYGNQFVLVEVTREDAPNPPDEEKRNQPQLSAVANYQVKWPSVGDNNIKELEKYVIECHKSLYYL